MKRMLAVLMLVIVSTQFSSSYRLTSVQPTINSTENTVELVDNEHKTEEIIDNIPLKTVILSPNKDIDINAIVNINEANKTEITLLARLIQSEALSEPYEGKIAVGSVVLNRMKEYNATMKDIIYAKNQFSGVHGKLFKREPSQECIQAAEDVLNGNRPVGNALYFVDLSKAKPSWVKKMQLVKRIGNHWFYKRK